MFNYSRVPARMIYMSILGLSIIAGFGIKGKHRFLSIILPILIVIDFLPKQRPGISIMPKSNIVYEYIKDKNYKGNILEIPIWPGDSSWSSLYQYYITLYRIQTINGYDPTVSQDYVDNVAEALFSVNLGQMNYNQYQVLKKLNVEYILFHEEAYPEKVCPFPPKYALELLKKSPYIDFVMTDGNIYLFKLKPLCENLDSELDYRGTSVIYNLYEVEYMPRNTGTVMVDETASGRGVVLGNIDSDREEFLTFGPHRTYPIGKYMAKFRLKVENIDEDESIARLEVATNNGKTILNSQEIRGIDFKESLKWRDFVVPFELTENSSVEFRIHFYRVENIMADCIIVYFADQDKVLSVYEAEDLIRETGRVLNDKTASKERAVYADTKEDISIRLVQGPYRTYGPGNYRASFWLKVDEDQGEINTDVPVVLLQVAADFGKREFVRKLLTFSDFKEKGVYQRFDYDFSLNNVLELDLRVTYKDKVGVWVDKIEVVKEGV